MCQDLSTIIPFPPQGRITPLVGEPPRGEVLRTRNITSTPTTGWSWVYSRWPRPYYEPKPLYGGESWLWYPAGGPYNPKVWKGPGRPPATLPHNGGIAPVQQVWNWPLEGYQSVV